MMKAVVWLGCLASGLVFLACMFLFYEASRPTPGANMVLIVMVYFIPVQLTLACLLIPLAVACGRDGAPRHKWACMIGIVMSVLPVIVALIDDLGVVRLF